ncbi:hypothetical protein LTR37_020159 [Vermiconidia calcicola]|uniref:Uncharacterized protein n=1 Tax=Vermiconidia calcicola TaxID=1690605 RepID=A0ACC3MDV1_9PEZI|nr:hypothetical protein LTR37_020159 [Vermiconidia calcicola]
MESKHAKDEQSQETIDSVPAGSPKQLSRWQKTYGAVGFNKGYNLPLFIIFAGAMFGFCAARLAYFNIHRYVAESAPGEWYWYQHGFYRVGLVMHIASVMPAGLLMVWQFVPIIRKKLLIFHRINGYIVIVLLAFGVASALMVARRSFGGAPATQAAIGLLAILLVVSLGMAYYNIKRLQIDQHRAWMLCVAFYCGTIITVRLIMIVAAQILPLTGHYYTTFSCDELTTLMGPKDFCEKYPQCFAVDGTNDGYVAVYASFMVDADTVGTALQLSFSMGLWLAIFMHVVGVEIYLNLTTAESERLRVVSYEKQLEAGMKHPGSAGLTADRWGDALAWYPACTAVVYSAMSG